MVYELYVEKIFFLQCLINLVSIKITDESLYSVVPFKRGVLGAVAGATLYVVLTVLWFLLLPRKSEWSFLLIGLCSVYLMTGICFRPKTVSGRWTIMERVYVVSAVLGSMVILSERILPHRETGVLGESVGILLIGGVWYGYQSFGQHNKRAGELCKVYVKGQGGETIERTGLIDSGSFLKEPISKKYVCVVREEVLKEIYKDGLPEFYRVIPYETIEHKHGYLQGYYQENMEIELHGISKKIDGIYLAAEPQKGGGEIEVILPKGVLEKAKIGKSGLERR